VRPAEGGAEAGERLLRKRGRLRYRADAAARDEEVREVARRLERLRCFCAEPVRRERLAKQRLGAGEVAARHKQHSKVADGDKRVRVRVAECAPRRYKVLAEQWLGAVEVPAPPSSMRSTCGDGDSSRRQPCNAHARARAKTKDEADRKELGEAARALPM
jgi:hypothetical protein